jgi:hypothetical protein
MADEFDHEAEEAGWNIRREIDKELISAIRKTGEIDRAVSRLNIAMFGFTGDNGVMGSVKALDGKIDKFGTSLSERDKALHKKIDDGLGGIYKALIGASLSFVVTSVVLVLGVILPG